MPLTLKQTVAPTCEPVTLALAKQHCRIDTTDDDALLGQLIQAAREKVEHDTGRQLITATWRLSMDAFPPLLDRNVSRLVPFVLRELYRPALGIIDRDVIIIPISPMIAVTSFTYVDDNGVTQTLTTNDYQLDTDSEPARMLPAYNTSWPDARSQANAVQLTYTAGYGADESYVPARAKQAVLFLIEHWYQNRELTGAIGPEIDQTYSNLIWGLRTFVPAA